MIRLLVLLFLFLSSFSSLANGFEGTVKDLLLKKLDSYSSVEVKFDSEIKLNKILQQEDKIESVALSFFSASSKSFKALVMFNGSDSLEIFGKYEGFFEVPVAIRNIKYREEISPDNVRMMKVKKLKIGESSTKSAENFYGMEAKYNIPQGSIIKISELKKLPIIHENDYVTLLFKAKDITLKTVGIALSEAASGEKIKVKNEKTGIIVFGEVQDRNIVKVSTIDDK